MSQDKITYIIIAGEDEYKIVPRVSEDMENGVLTNGSLAVPDRVLDGADRLPLGERPVVLKFGGTSVGKFAPEIAQICL